jgi:hypothetical protein
MRIKEQVVNLINSEIENSIKRYGEPGNCLEYAMLVNKEAVEVLDGTVKIETEGITDYRKWAISHNLIQTISACIKYLEYLEKEHKVDFNNFDMEKPNENKTETTA